MVLEVEVKYSVPDFRRMEAVLDSWGARIEPPRRDSDRYFNSPERDFAVSDEALRIRSIGDQNVITYKGPKIDKETKSRLEIEVPLANGAVAATDLGEVLIRLGYRPVAVVNKTRRIAKFTRDGFDMKASLDEVDGVGTYAEVETMAPESRFAEAKAAVLAAAAELGMSQPERRSYLQLLLERRPEE